MKYKATRDGVYPAGVNWTKGKVRNLPKVGDDLPDWLVPVEAKKKAKKKD